MALGGTVGELQQRMGHREFQHWQAFYQHEPFGGLRGDIQGALIAATIANANRDKKRRRTPFTPTDFLPDYWGERQRRKAAELGEKFEGLARALGHGDSAGNTGS